MTTVSLIYRDNHLFTQNMPTVLTQLHALGLHVETQVFPCGTAEQDIGVWMSGQSFTRHSLLIDDTCRSFLPSAVADQAISLDEFFYRVTVYEGVQSGLESDELNHLGGEKDLAVFERHFRTILHKVLSSGVAMPRSVAIVAKRLWDHEPFHAWHAERKRVYCDSGADPQLQSDPDYRNTFMMFETVPGQRDDLAVAGIVKRMLIGAGLPADIITIAEDLQPVADWIVIDRHRPRNGRFSNADSNPAMVLELPLPNLLWSVVQQRLSTEYTDIWDAALSRVIAHMFQPVE